MWNTKFFIGVSPSGISVVQRSGTWRVRHEVVAECVLTGEQYAQPEVWAAQLNALLREVPCAKASAHLVLSEHGLRRWMVTPPQNARSLADCEAAVQARFGQLFGDTLNDWHWRADWDAHRPFMAFAMPRAVLDGLLQVAAAHQLRLLDVAPQFAVAWNRWHKKLQPHTWFGVLHQGVLSYAVLGQDGALATRDLCLPADVLSEQARILPLLAREALRLNVPQPARLSGCGAVPEHWAMHTLGGVEFARLDRVQGDASPAAALALTGVSVSDGMRRIRAESPIFAPQKS